MDNLERILLKAEKENSLTIDELYYLFNLSKERDLNRLFATARSLRSKYFGKKIFLYGFLYLSTWCRNNCNFCYFRKSNSKSVRYRKTAEEIIEAALSLAESGVHLIDLTLGEDPFYHNPKGMEVLSDLIGRVKSKTGLSIMVSPGVISEKSIKMMKDAGADWYACYQETYNRKLFNVLRPNQSFDQRIFSKYSAVENGLLIEEGILTGVGESWFDFLRVINAISEMQMHQIRVMSFVPQEGTPMEGLSGPAVSKELKIIALFRLLFPDRLIPASLDVEGIKGLKPRIDAGANVITSLIPPRIGLAGVAQNKKDINEGWRTVYEVLPILDEMGLQAAFSHEYIKWLKNEMENLCQKPGKIQHAEI
ncbi:MAG: methylornithine synthase PylB [Bacillota bacterium]